MRSGYSYGDGGGASSAESAQAIGFMVIFPLTFISSAFVPLTALFATLSVQRYKRTVSA
jgi:hypothetical protein